MAEKAPPQAEAGNPGAPERGDDTAYRVETDPRADSGATSADKPDITALYRSEQLPMIRLATLLTGSAALAEEVVQDAFAAVDHRWAALERPGAYLRTAVVNGAAAVLRRREVEDRYRPRLVSPTATEMPTRLVELSDALDTLTERQRMVVVLRYFLDLPDEQIGVELGVKPSTVRSLAHRALNRLRKELA